METLTLPLVEATNPSGASLSKFQILPVPETETYERQMRLHRLNGLGSLYYFIKIVLGRKRLTKSLHLPICNSLERLYLKDLYELPRRHFKTTMTSEGRPLWRALPISNQDIDDFKSLGYSDEFVRFMLQIHNPDIKMLLVSANITNAAMIGKRIKRHVESNAVYRTLFPETLPTTQEKWTDFSLHMRRTKGSAPHGEGTFDFLGADSALQSRHYHEVNQDDLVGPKAIESPSIMKKIIEFHQLLPGAFDTEDATHENPELITGNRWDFHDLNSHIRENEPWFAIHSHSALGGCCSEHPPDQPIFPEEFSFEKLERLRHGSTAYQFSCQYLNNPCSPEDSDFRPEWLKFYDFKSQSDVNGEHVDRKIIHEVYEGNANSDLSVGNLSLALISDPNHSGNSGQGRCRHSVVVVGLSSEGNYYLLDCWAQASGYDTYYAKIFEFAKKWNIHRLGLETIAAQKYIGHHIEWLSKHTSYRLSIIPLKGEVTGPEGTTTRKKEERIRTALVPLFEWGNFWIRRSFQDFQGEYNTFPKGKFLDILDALAYAPQVLKHGSVSNYKTRSEWLSANQRGAMLVNQPYSARIQ